MARGHPCACGTDRGGIINPITAIPILLFSRVKEAQAPHASSMRQLPDKGSHHSLFSVLSIPHSPPPPPPPHLLHPPPPPHLNRQKDSTFFRHTSQHDCQQNDFSPTGCVVQLSWTPWQTLQQASAWTRLVPQRKYDSSLQSPEPGERGWLDSHW